MFKLILCTDNVQLLLKRTSYSVAPTHRSPAVTPVPLNHLCVLYPPVTSPPIPTRPHNFVEDGIYRTSSSRFQRSVFFLIVTTCYCTCLCHVSDVVSLLIPLYICTCKSYYAYYQRIVGSHLNLYRSRRRCSSWNEFKYWLFTRENPSAHTQTHVMSKG